MPSSRYEIGDRVELTLEVVDRTFGLSYPEVHVVGHPNADQRWVVSEEALDAGKRVPRPIKVGDRVHYKRVVDPATLVVIAIHEGWAWTKRDDIEKGYASFSVSDLVRVSP